ncbi:hypothetical protein LZG04_12180 [Saccharothrix sp. S26]|uniref:sigma factor n=1 Tax=Saccharothrix sp. S26 TaxID=2907215 RepID=UPI001F4816C0|nr:sigma factor [Saccharothrix sp. S26]MCE6995553.1 hypothetical protein [Saccharothrix sp. S26]
MFGHRQDRLAPAGRDAGGLSLRRSLTGAARWRRAAFARFYDRVAGRVFGLARLMFDDPGRAEEAALEALTGLWRDAPRYDPDHDAGIWTIVHAHRLLVDRVRAGHDTTRDPAPADPATDLSAKPSFEVPPAVRDLLHDLPWEQARALTLVWYRGLTYREAAHRLGVRPGVVASLAHTDVLRLHDRLTPTVPPPR